MIELRGTFQAWLQQRKDRMCQKIPLCYYDDDDEESSTPLSDIIIHELPPCIAITPFLSTKDSLIMGDEHLDTIPEKEPDEFIKSSIENLIPNPSESEDERIDEADCDPEEEIRLIKKLLYENSSPRPPEEFNLKNSDAVIESISPFPISFEDSDPFMEEIDLFLTSDGSIPLRIDSDYSDSEGDDHFSEKIDSDPFMEEIDLFLASGGSIPPGIDSDYSDSEGDNLFLETLLHDDPIPLPDILNFSNVVRVFLTFFTYPVTSLILLSSGSEDTIFDPDISNYHFSSLEPGVSRQSGTFMKFNFYPNHLNESPMEILSSTCFLMDQ
nr:hypothetical protein [Tanacetum cinerariifolium]